MSRAIAAAVPLAADSDSGANCGCTPTLRGREGGLERHNDALPEVKDGLMSRPHIGRESCPHTICAYVGLETAVVSDWDPCSSPHALVPG